MANPTDRHDGYDTLHWPLYDSDSERGYVTTQAYNTISVNRTLDNGAWRWLSNKERGAWPRLRLVCQERGHKGHPVPGAAMQQGFPNLAEV